MSLQGNLRDFSASDILQLLATQKKTGCLILERERRSHTVFVQEGRIVSTRGSTTPGQDPLLRFVIRIRRLSEEQMRGIMSLLQESRRDLEDLLVNGRYLDAEALASLLERQILDDLVDLVDWKDGTYKFVADRVWPHPVWIRLNIEASLIEAARRVDERTRFREIFRDSNQFAAVVDLPASEEEISEEESEMFAILDGRRTIAEAVAAAALSDYEAYEALMRMVHAGWVQLGERSAGTPDVPPPVEETLQDSVVTRAPAGRVARAIVREVAVAATILAILGTLWIAARAVPGPRGRGEDTAFAAARVRDVRYVLELYRHETGAYPRRIDDLITDGWLDAKQLIVDGRRLSYRPVDERHYYELTLPR